MKTVIKIMILTTFISCGTTNRNTEAISSQQEMIEEVTKEDKMIGPVLPSWTRKSGIANGMVYAIGKAEFDVNKSEYYVEKAATMDGEIKLLTDAPSDVRVLTQNALTGAGIDSAEFFQIQTKLQEVVGLTGIRHSEEHITCRKMIRYDDMFARVTRSCWVQVSIPLKELVVAYRRTLALKFGTYKANEFKDLMMDQIDKIQNNPLLNKGKDNEQASKKSVSNSDDEFDNLSDSSPAQLSAKEPKSLRE